MSDQYSPEKVYQQRIAELERSMKELSDRKRMLGTLRFLALVAALAAIWFFWSMGIGKAATAFILLFLVFLFVVKLDLKNRQKIANAKRILDINHTEKGTLQHRFTHLSEGRVPPPSHSYAADLDIFGKASLYQYINRTYSEQGQDILSNWLLYPSEENSIAERQQAVQELQQLTPWRQQLQAYGSENPVTHQMATLFSNWLKQPNSFFGKIVWEVLRYVLPAIAITVLVLHISGFIPASGFYLLVILFMLVSYGIGFKTINSYNQLNKVNPQLSSLSSIAGWTEKQSFQSEKLKQLQQKLWHKQTSASVIIAKLNKILERMDYRLNPVGFLLNTFLFWDLQQVCQLEKWKHQYGQEVSQWSNVLGEMEALNSLGTLYFNHPSWCFPVLSKEYGLFEAEQLGHPLIPAVKMIPNSFSTKGIKQIGLITGSNMAGKSTFLRSIGVNIVLAMMGAPVCATRFSLYPVKVMTSMRITDNLEESTSTFYAELKKLKQIIESVNAHEKIFVLLDEMLRGTNSFDRQAGSIALIRQMLKKDAVGIIATHDLELTRLSDEFPSNIHNYHFDVQVEKEELYFDYKLKNGVCQSMNASILMKKIGIEL